MISEGCTTAGNRLNQLDACVRPVAQLLLKISSPGADILQPTPSPLARLSNSTAPEVVSLAESRGTRCNATVDGCQSFSLNASG
jgi:hypothetical protein